VVKDLWPPTEAKSIESSECAFAKALRRHCGALGPARAGSARQLAPPLVHIDCSWACCMRLTVHARVTHAFIVAASFVPPRTGSAVRMFNLGAASVASFLAAILTEIYLCNVCSDQEILRHNGRG
jgi:hypothetical protein